MNELDQRLRMLFCHVPSCGCVADIGTDHGYLPISLLKKGICDKAIATDISEASLQKAKQNSKWHGIPLDCRLGDGLSPLNDKEADCIVIAGMGGILISNILAQEKEKAVHAILVLQPMTAVKELREYLCKSGFRIVAEDLVFQDQKLYHALKAKYCGEIQEYDCEIGDCLRNHPLFEQYLSRRKQKERNILENMGDFRGQEYRQHWNLLRRLEQEEIK